MMVGRLSGALVVVQQPVERAVTVLGRIILTQGPGIEPDQVVEPIAAGRLLDEQVVIQEGFEQVLGSAVNQTR
jgi:hypothetical protein